MHFTDGSCPTVHQNLIRQLRPIVRLLLSYVYSMKEERELSKYPASPHNCGMSISRVKNDEQK